MTATPLNCACKHGDSLQTIYTHQVNHFFGPWQEAEAPKEKKTKKTSRCHTKSPQLRMKLGTFMLQGNSANQRTAVTPFLFAISILSCPDFLLYFLSLCFCPFHLLHTFFVHFPFHLRWNFFTLSPTVTLTVFSVPFVFFSST